MKNEFFLKGEMVHVGKNFKNSCHTVEIDDLTYIADDVIIEGNKFVMGKGGFIGFQSLINADHGIWCGDNVCIGPRTMIYTHAHWNSILEGYYCKHEKVVIEDDVWIGACVVVLPGVKIGEGSVVTVNSVVMNDIPAHCLATGNPAKVVIKDYPKKPSKNKKEEIMNKIYRELKWLLDEKKFDYFLCINSDFIAVNHYKKEPVIFNLIKKKISGEQDDMTDEVREYLRKRGIKFDGLWRYKAGEKD